ncbi:UNVERIFIED_CONTAM: hypothetical protein NY603_40325, partial [Bacteroidetes bacterium 56_B9]
MLLDLMGGDSTLPSGETGSSVNGMQANNADLLADILGGGDASASTAAHAPSSVANGQPKTQSNM